jgi:cell division septation protein DedD
VAAILLGDPPSDGTPAAGTLDQQTTAPQDPGTSVPALPTVDGGTPTSSIPAPTDPNATTTAAPSGTGTDPLGLGVSMTPPACDGTWIVILGSATDPATYLDDVTALLSRDANAKYALTQGACASLRQATPEGNQIYAVYLGPYPDQAAACAVSATTGSGAYVKRMDDTTPPDQTWAC